MWLISQFGSGRFIYLPFQWKNYIPCVSYCLLYMLEIIIFDVLFDDGCRIATLHDVFKIEEYYRRYLEKKNK